MDILTLIPFAYDKLFIFILAFGRISSLFATFVFFKKEIVNRRIIVALSAVLSIYAIMLHPQVKLEANVLSLPMMINFLFQCFIGFIAGLILNIVFDIFTMLGQILSTQVGLSMASMYDPSLGSITDLTQFYSFSISIVFLHLNGHIFIIKTILDTFSIFSFDLSSLPVHFFPEIIKYSSVIFSGAVMLAITVMVAMLLVNFSLAVMTRFASQFNIFSIGMNMTVIIGIICVFMTYHLFIEKGAYLLEQSLAFYRQFMLGMR